MKWGLKPKMFLSLTVRLKLYPFKAKPAARENRLLQKSFSPELRYRSG